MKNKLLSVLLLGAALGLTACGGDSDSSGSTNVTPTDPKPKPPIITPPATTTTCQTTATDITVPNNSSCTFSLPKYNSGAISTVTCNNGTVSLGGITAGKGITINGVTISCAK